MKTIKELYNDMIAVINKMDTRFDESAHYFDDKPQAYPVYPMSEKAIKSTASKQVMN